MKWKYLVMMVMATVQMHTPPHWLMGYSWAEWGGIVAVAGLISGIVIGLAKIAIINPQNAENRRQNEKVIEMNRGLQHSIDGLADGVKELRESSDRVHEYLDHRIDDHETRISVIEEEVSKFKG